MTQSPKIISNRGRGEWRLLAGFVFIGFGLAFWAVTSHETAGEPNGRVWARLITGVAIFVGLCIVLFKSVVVLYPEQRQVVQGILFVRKLVHRRVWSFSDFQRVEIRWWLDEGTYVSAVVLVPAGGQKVWLRSYSNEPAAGPSENAIAFAKELSDTIGVPHEIRGA